MPDSYYLDEALNTAQVELNDKCDYARERENYELYRANVMSDNLLKRVFYVPFIVGKLCTRKILATELIGGVPIDKIITNSNRNEIATNMLRLAIRELFIHNFQQSDPNYANYLHDGSKSVTNLIDFGAARQYEDDFLPEYLHLIVVCADRNKSHIIDRSINLGFLTGEESNDMIDAHVQASLAVGEPFENNGEFDFSGCDILKRTAEFGKVMLDQRLTPPPKEAYALHRRLSGAFLLSTKLSAKVNARYLLDQTIDELQATGRLSLS